MATLYLKADDNTYVELDVDTRRTALLVKPELRAQLQAVRARLQALPDAPTNAELLAWAKEHWPRGDEMRERAMLVAERDRLIALLVAIGEIAP